MDLTEMLAIDNEAIQKLLERYSDTEDMDLKSFKFSPSEKEAMLGYIENLDKTQWKAMTTKPKVMSCLSLDGEVFAVFLKKAIKNFNTSIERFVSQEYFNENSILHCLSKDPLAVTQLEIIMYVLQQPNVKLDAKNGDNKTFLNVSPIHSKLLQEIQTSPDDWAKKLFGLFCNSPNIIERWIVLGDDFILEALLNRLIQSLSLLSKVCTLSFLLYVHLMSLVAHPLIC